VNSFYDVDDELTVVDDELKKMIIQTSVIKQLSNFQNIKMAIRTGISFNFVASCEYYFLPKLAA